MKVNQHSGKTFLLNVVSFAFIFLAISFIVFQIISASIYNSVDQDLLNAVSFSKANKEQIEDAIYSEILSNISSDDVVHRKLELRNYPVQYLIWSKDGKLLNETTTNQFYSFFENLKLDKSNLGRIQELHCKSDSGQIFRYHSVTVDTTNLLSDTIFANSVQYVQLLINTDQIYQAQVSFKKVLISCMVFFWLVSIGVSFFISKVAMQPVLLAWKKQQEFVENASHELRTPLAIIQSKLESMLTRPSNTVIDESENIALSLAETRRLNQLTKDLLQLARADNANMPLKKENVNIKRLVNQVVEPYKEISVSQNKTLLTSILSDSVGIFDEKKIHQLLVILVDNALKYTPPGGTIELISTVKNGNWLLEVKDTGVGVKDEDKKKIFERFFREDNSRQRDTGGYGLGLAIAKEIVEQHNGKIQVVDNQPIGSIFQVSIPVGKDEKKAKVTVE